MAESKNNLLERLAAIQEDATLRGAEGIVEALEALQGEVRQSKADEVTIANSEEMTKQLEKGIKEVTTTLKKELKKLDKEIVVKNDLSQLLALFKTKTGKKDVVKVLKAIENKIPKIEIPEMVDYTLMLNEILNGIEGIKKTDISKVEGLLEDIKHKNTSFDLDPMLVDDDRLRVALPDKQVAKMGQAIISGSNSQELVDKQILQDYKLSDIEEGDTSYMGYTTKNGAWYIKRITSVSVRYSRGTSGYDWSNRAGEDYDYFYNTF